jgi:hypothetical protein
VLQRRRVALVGGYDMEGAGEPARLP